MQERPVSNALFSFSKWRWIAKIIFTCCFCVTKTHFQLGNSKCSGQGTKDLDQEKRNFHKNRETEIASFPTNAENIVPENSDLTELLSPWKDVHVHQSQYLDVCGFGFGWRGDSSASKKQGDLLEVTTEVHLKAVWEELELKIDWIIQ